MENETNDMKTKCLSNEEAWNKGSYDAWLRRFGTPYEAALKIKTNPTKTLSPLLEKFGDVSDKKIMNLLGSNGSKAVALALLGAHPSVVDFSEGNRLYALELAEDAGVNFDYILSVVLLLPDQFLTSDFDIVFAEMGILHYFEDLGPFFNVFNVLLKDKGRLIIRDFHPVTTKLITSRGTTAKIRKHKVTGDYFDTSLEEKEVAYQKYLSSSEERQIVRLRKWTMGEIVTAIASEGFIIKRLDEEENLSSEVFDKGIPKTFTIVAEKMSNINQG